MNHKTQLKNLLSPYFSALYKGEQAEAAGTLNELCSDDVVFHLSHPFGDFIGSDAWNEGPMHDLFASFPDVERRDFIRTAGVTAGGDAWVGCAGFFVGTFASAFLGIPPTGRITAFRYHEFYRVVNDKVVEYQSIWDLPELMSRVGVWPMAPSLGREAMTLTPALQNGLVQSTDSEDVSAHSLEVVTQMLVHMGKHPKEPAESMKLSSFWHPKFNWYGPSGIGAMRGIEGFRYDHQIPFLNAMPDRQGGYDGELYFWADEDYVGVTAWPGMRMTFTGSGWLGIVPNQQNITMRSLDFWRVEYGLIRENWVLVDLLDVWNQLGVDVMARMSELTR